MLDIKGKRLLILGGTSASYDLVKNAREMGVYTIVTDDGENRISKEIADEKAMVSTIDMDGLSALIKEKRVDGVFCGPSEFNLRNVIKLCELTGLPCYTNMEKWDECANKDVFKRFCRQFNVDCTPEYTITENMSDDELEKIDYPIIIKPVDGCSSFGITVCHDKTTVTDAYKKAMDASKCKRIIAEKYIDNGGELFGVRYLLKDGEAFPYLTIDTYVTDPIHRTSLTSAFTYAPSKYTDYYMKNMDAAVRKMFKGMGLKNGTAFIQALPCDGKIYFHEMGYRLSGGMIFKLTQPLMGINDMKMMIRFALGGEMFTAQELSKIDLSGLAKVGAQLMIPLSSGTIAKIKGLEQCKKLPCVSDFIQYYSEGECVKPSFIGTLAQHFGRFTLIANNQNEIFDTVKNIQQNLEIVGSEGQRMNEISFDLHRV